jgi:membrane protease YdiL (CAAX protease family)
MNLVKRYPQAVFWLIAWLTSFLGYYLSVKYPSDIWILFILGPFVGGALVTAFADGSQGLKTFFSRIVRWRVGLRWYAVAIFLPLVLRLAAFGLNILSGAKIVAEPQWPAWSDLLMESLVFSIIIGIGEEPGFRGFALPRLMKGRSALTASLILGALHTIWHAPLLISGEETLVIIPIIFSGAVLNTWLFNHTNGSVFLALILHASVDLWVGVFNPLFGGADAAQQTNWLAAVYVGLAILLPLLAGKELGRMAETATERIGARQPMAAK